MNINNPDNILNPVLEQAKPVVAAKPMPIITSRTPAVKRIQQRTLRGGAINEILPHQGRKYIQTAFLEKRAQIEAMPETNISESNLKASMKMQLMTGFTDTCGYVTARVTGLQIDSVKELETFFLTLNWQKAHKTWNGKHIFEYAVPEDYVAYIGEETFSSLMTRAAVRDQNEGLFLPKFDTTQEWDTVLAPEKGHVASLIANTKVVGTIRHVPRKFNGSAPTVMDFRWLPMFEVVDAFQTCQTFTVLLDDKFKLIKFQVGRLLDELFPYQRAAVATITPVPSL